MSNGIGTQPLVSVCVPSYNYGRFLSDCIRSVQEQTLPDWELLICDDCSTDGTKEIVERYVAEDERVRYIRNECRLGMNANLSRVAQQARGKYLKILCADDWLLPACLEQMAGLLEKYSRVVLGTSAVVMTEEDGTPYEVNFLFGTEVAVLPGAKMLNRMARGHGFGGNSSFLIRSSAYRRVGGYDPTVRYAADYDLAARLCRIGDYLHTDAALFYGRSHPNSSTSKDPKKLVDVVDRFKIPDKIFRPRRFLDREWRRYSLLTGLLTARYSLNLAFELLRGHYQYASSLGKILRSKGNFVAGLPLLLLHVPARIMRRVTGRHRPISREPEAWMGPPGGGSCSPGSVRGAS